MRTTVVIDDGLIEKAMKASNARTKREVIEMGLRELICEKNLKALKEELGTYHVDMSLEELERLRSEP